MKNLLVLLTATGVLLAVGNGFATDLNVNDAWVGGLNSSPTTASPQDLATWGTKLNSTQKGKINSDNGVWYQWNEPSDKDYDWLMCVYDDPNPSSATSNWQVAIDHDTNKANLYYWHSDNENWVWLARSDDSRDPSTQHTNCLAVFQNNGGDDPQAILLFVGYTPAPADNWIKCDVADITYN